MYTLCIRYQFNPEKIADIRAYFDEELPVIERSGGVVLGYFTPTDFVGPNNEAIGLIDFPSLAAYEEYRGILAADPEHRRNVARLMSSGAGTVMTRSIIQRVAQR